MSILLQISDPHFGTEQAEVVEALVMLARQQQPDLLVLSGDITQRARPAQFRAARAFTDRLRVPVLAVPGNHDLPLFEPWARLRRPYCVFRRSVTVRFGIVTAEFGSVTEHFGDVTDARLVAA